MAVEGRWCAQLTAIAPSAAFTRRLVLAAVLCGLPVAAFGAELLLGRVSHVADGDTLTLIAEDSRQRIRLFQIDAPEHDQPGSAEARRALADKVDGRYVRVETEAVDDYGRIVGTVRLGDRDINRELVREGHAWAYRRFLEDESLLAEEAAARQARRGLWSRAEPVPPWQWRRRGDGRSPGLRDRPQGTDAAGRRCDIKGNVNRRGDRIYHRPGDRHYDVTRIDVGRGERWFCTVQEAERAGWRAPR